MSLQQAAESLAEVLANQRRRVVFAESCTCGLVCATLGEIPGISHLLCGSAVTYRDDTKRRWLEVSEGLLAQHTAVSAPVATQMAVGVLTKTAEAHVAMSVTGHLGPDAPADLDGLLFIGIASRRELSIETGEVRHYRLQTNNRLDRQVESATIAIEHLVRVLQPNSVAD